MSQLNSGTTVTLYNNFEQKVRDEGVHLEQKFVDLPWNAPTSLNVSIFPVYYDVHLFCFPCLKGSVKSLKANVQPKNTILRTLIYTNIYIY